jgi:hypothetical protein
MSDEDKKKAGQEDDLITFKDMSEKTSRDRLKEPPESVGQKQYRSTSNDQEMNEPTEAINHRDLFRSDKGGAAINFGEEGFDEEMGGQTQAAYEIYENVKDDLSEETENSDDDIVSDEHKNSSKRGTECDNDKKQSGLASHAKSAIFDEMQNSSLKYPRIARSQTNAKMESDTKQSYHASQVKSEVFDEIDETQKSSQKKPSIASRQINVEMRSDTKNVCGGSFPSPRVSNSSEVSSPSDVGSTRKQVSESSCEGKLELDSTTPGQETNRHEPHVSKTNSTNESHGTKKKSSNQTKNKILLMGCVNIDDAKTTFSAADLRRPDYKRKKKKKKKKS